MADVTSIRAIWGGVSDETAGTIYGEMRTENADLYRQAQGTAAAALRMRPQVFRQKPAAWQAANVRRTLTQVGQDELGARLLIEWLTKKQTPMLSQFLDELGLEHEDGTIKDEVGPQPQLDKLTAAVTHLRESFPPEYVRVYLQSFYLITASEWEALPQLIE